MKEKLMVILKNPKYDFLKHQVQFDNDIIWIDNVIVIYQNNIKDIEIFEYPKNMMELSITMNEGLSIIIDFMLV